MSRPLIILTAALAALLGGCLTPYRMEIAQGNVITQESVNQLRLGMTRSQVRFILGTPMVADTFHTDRWDYYYSLVKTNEHTPQTRHVTVTFKNDLLASIEGDVKTDALPVSAKP
jgi:outer membrane protein assembly factor BamE